MSLTVVTELPLRPLRAATLAVLPAVAAVRAATVDPLPPCPLRALTGVPCPLCGSTRGVVAALQGDVGRSLTLNPAAIVALVAVALLLIGWRVERVRFPVWSIVVVVGALWAYQLSMYAAGRPL